MRVLCVLLLSLLACSKPVITPASTFTYDDEKGNSVLLSGRQVKVTSTHFDPIAYTLASDNMALKLSEFNAAIDQGAVSNKPPSLGNGTKTVAAASCPDAQVLIDQLVPKKDGVGPDSAWVGGVLGHEDLEGGFWTLTALGNKFVLTDPPPGGIEKGQTVILTGGVASDEMSAANSGPQYRPTAWRVYKD